MKKINLIYWKDITNFGDYLSPFIISKYTTQEIRYKRRWWGWKPFLKELRRIIIHRQWHDLDDLTFPYEKVILSVGSILKFANYNSYICGAGFMNESETITVKPKAYAVRGWETARKLQVLGIHCDVVGDPAILLPKFCKNSNEKIHDIGIIPHWSEYDQISEQALNIIGGVFN